MLYRASTSRALLYYLLVFVRFRGKNSRKMQMQNAIKFEQRLHTHTQPSVCVCVCVCCQLVMHVVLPTFVRSVANFPMQINFA